MGDDVIPVATAVTLDGLFRERVARTPDAVAFRHYNDQYGNWRDYTWAQMARQVGRWQVALRREGLQPGDRVAVMMRNTPDWVLLDIAALGLGLVVVPLYTQDRPDNIGYILNDAGCKVLLFENEVQWNSLRGVHDALNALVRILSVKPCRPENRDPRLALLEEWLPEHDAEPVYLGRDSAALATIVYTSGTTGRPKGVMLSHANILSNCHACLTGVMSARHEDVFLSFLPLSHTFERTCGYYLPMMAGATVAYARSIAVLAEDLVTIRPSILVSVPRIYERIWSNVRAKLDQGPAWRKALFNFAVKTGYERFEYLQRRGRWHPAFLLWPLLHRLVASKVLERLGGRLRAALSGGAALPPNVSRVFIGLGLPVIQGYGMTEASPVIAANRLEDNVPASVGPAIPGVEVRLGDNNALLVRGPNVMQGYWNNPEATRAILLDDGWLNTGDTVRIEPRGHIYITGRLKDIIVMSNGEKVPPFDMETAIMNDPLFEQVMVIGEGKAYLSAVLVLNPEHWQSLCGELSLDPAAAKTLHDRKAMHAVLVRVSAQTRHFPGYAHVRRVVLSLEPWTIENGFMTPTLKLRRNKVMETFNAEIDGMYEGM